MDKASAPCQREALLEGYSHSMLNSFELMEFLLVPFAPTFKNLPRLMGRRLEHDLSDKLPAA